MRTPSKAILGAIAIYGLYFTATLAAGYVKSMNTKPDWEVFWTNAEDLPSEVAFGYAPSPFLYVRTFSSMVLTCGILLIMYDKIVFKSLKAGAS